MFEMAWLLLALFSSLLFGWSLAALPFIAESALGKTILLQDLSMPLFALEPLVLGLAIPAAFHSAKGVLNLAEKWAYPTAPSRRS